MHQTKRAIGTKFKDMDYSVARHTNDKGHKIELENIKLLKSGTRLAN